MGGKNLVRDWKPGDEAIKATVVILFVPSGESY